MPDPDFGQPRKENAKPAVQPGAFYVVGTPIGNLGDLTSRSAAVLESVDLVAAEDTRRTLQLLNHLGLHQHLESYHAHNWQVKGPQLADQMLSGRSVALVADAGMPCISDPGEELVRLCVDRGIPVIIIPGPCAAIAGLAGSGLPTSRFVFEGFLPAAGKARKERLAELAAEKRTVVFYEAPHRIRKTLADLASSGLAQRRLTLGRELTKHHEEFIRVTVGDAIQYYQDLEPRGEYVLILEGQESFIQRCPGDSPAGSETEEKSRELLRAMLRDGLTVKDAVRRCQDVTGLRKNDLYQLALSLQPEPKV
ncbi:MAG TPA: 16S rRNA (cytidine(1402)-2'-O)-methyltransferase [Clostridiales bacterium]|nr:16S rRNA (cytidine(1402)-2'-O)-methyltransferase [Clostridiales bacterium]